MPRRRRGEGRGERAKQLRVLRNLQQKELAAHAGVGVATVQRFEATGKASLENVVRIAIALRAEASFDDLFLAPRYASLEEAIARPLVARRQRVKRKKKSHPLELAKVTRVPRAEEILAEVAKAVSRFAGFADEAEVPAMLRNQVAQRLSVAKKAVAKKAAAKKAAAKKAAAKKRR